MILEKRLAAKTGGTPMKTHVMILRGLFTFCLVHRDFIAEIVCLVTLCWEMPEVQGTNCESMFALCLEMNLLVYFLSDL